MGVAGCSCKEVYRFPHTYLYLFFFTAASLLFVHKKKVLLVTSICTYIGHMYMY